MFSQISALNIFDTVLENPESLIASMLVARLHYFKARIDVHESLLARFGVLHFGENLVKLVGARADKCLFDVLNLQEEVRVLGLASELEV